MHRKIHTSLLAALCLAPFCAAAEPFFTGDGTTVPYKEWEFELNSTMTFAEHEPDEKSVGLEIKYGLLSRVELFLEMGYDHISKDHTGEEVMPALHGVGDSEIGFKYRFLDECAIGPKMAIEPRLGLPTANKKMGNDRMWFKIPLWLEKNWGDFSTSGGAGYVFNDADEAKNFTFAGWKVRYDLTESLNIGAEIFYQGADSTDNSDVTLANLGTVYKLNDAFNLQLGLGHSIHGEKQTVLYLGIST